ncbi:hypothetical protein E2C01_053073 [Portunus trituberculatus]|uniref:Uncharacterized protein n=1 Tax=Portunus trituberculatus TaxID=210409 RepID=A0A5B7GPU5_PORTR|nr:hypothetical protein [Portunus trituberculatus]
MLASSVSSGTTERTESVPGRSGPASPGKPDDLGVTSIETLQAPTGTGEQTTSLARSTPAMGSSTTRTPGLKGLLHSGGPGGLELMKRH